MKLENYYRTNFDTLVSELGSRIGHHNAEDAIHEAFTQVLTLDNFDEEEFNNILKKCISKVMVEQRTRGMTR